ncbi:MAG TPA: prolipoprotein diacylglyceryl transferase [bacterium]|nr:prolipoprotein diacylglyceryl transferase [bacterium]HPP13026.1 prolipoprotein diacylglyceryl transferase [bacterium]
MSPIFLKIGSFVIYWYGVMAALGILIAGSIFQRLAGRAGLSQKVASEILVWLVVSGLAGARTVHVMTHFWYYYRHPLEILALRNGGLAIQGGIIGATIFLSLYALARRLPFFKIVDLVSTAAPLGQAIGRLGCFLHGCCYGKETDSFAGVHFPAVEGRIHPTQLYYFAADMAVFCCLWWLLRQRLREGTVFCLYLMAMGLIRYNLDFLRGDLVSTSLGLYPTQWFGIILFLTGATLLLRLMSRPGEMPEPAEQVCSSPPDEQKKEVSDHG